MQYLTLGRTELNVSRIAFGGWQAAGWEKSDDKTFTLSLEDALEKGVTLIDTAESYGKGHSETLIGKALSKRRHQTIIATKFSYDNSTPEKMRTSLEESLRRLKTDYIDIYQQHWPPLKPPLEESLLTLEAFRKEGKIRAIGVCNWMEPEWAEIDSPARIDSSQSCYSLLWRGIENSVKARCIEKQIALLCYSPLCQGILGGRFTSVENLPRDSRRQNRFLTEETFPKLASLLDLIGEIAKRYQRTKAQVALAWLLSQPGVTSIIVGVTSTAQLDENLGSLNTQLGVNDLNDLSEASLKFSEGIGPHESLWGWHPRMKDTHS